MRKHTAKIKNNVGYQFESRGEAQLKECVQIREYNLSQPKRLIW